MTHITIISTLSPSQKEIENFLRCVNSYSELNTNIFVSLVLIDNLGVGKLYSSFFYELLDACSIIVTIKENSHDSKLEAIVSAASKVVDGVILVMDPDMYANLIDVPKFLDEINGGSLVVYGNRVNRNDVSFLRFALSKGFNRLIKFLFNLKLSDINTPMVMLDPSVVHEMRTALKLNLLLKVYLPYSVLNKFSEVNISVFTEPKKSSYTWPALIKQAIDQFYRTYKTMDFIAKGSS